LGIGVRFLMRGWQEQIGESEYIHRKWSYAGVDTTRVHTARVHTSRVRTAPARQRGRVFG
jgi:hypothetical protein